MQILGKVGHERNRRCMRKQGTITRWDDARGFGFISREQGTDDIFVHISAFSRNTRRPEVGDTVFYEIQTDKSGKTQAVSANFTDEPEPTRQAVGKLPRTAWPVVFTWMFVVALVVAALFDRLPWLVVAAYGVMSLVTFLLYGWDKLSAVRGRWRTAEATLHLMGLLGGWPGALAAQRLFRHKSSKREFLLVFWGTVILNVIAVGNLVWSGNAGFMYQWLDRVW